MLLGCHSRNRTKVVMQIQIDNGIIVSATETELYSYWLPRYSDIMSFPDFLEKFKGNGGIVIEKGGDNHDD